MSITMAMRQSMGNREQSESSIGDFILYAISQQERCLRLGARKRIVCADL